MLVLKGLQGKAFVLIDLQENTKSISFVMDETSSVPFGDYLLNYKTVSEEYYTTQKPDTYYVGTKAITDGTPTTYYDVTKELQYYTYTYNDNVKIVDAKIKEKLAMPEFRRKRL